MQRSESQLAPALGYLWQAAEDATAAMIWEHESGMLSQLADFQSIFTNKI